MAQTFERWGGLEFSSTYFRCTDAQPPPSRRRILSPTGRWLTGGRCSFSPERQTRFRVFKKMSSGQFGSGTKLENLHYRIGPSAFFFEHLACTVPAVLAPPSTEARDRA